MSPDDAHADQEMVEDPAEVPEALDESFNAEPARETLNSQPTECTLDQQSTPEILPSESSSLPEWSVLVSFLPFDV